MQEFACPFVPAELAALVAEIPPTVTARLALWSPAAELKNRMTPTATIRSELAVPMDRPENVDVVPLNPCPFALAAKLTVEAID